MSRWRREQQKARWKQIFEVQRWKQVGLLARAVMCGSQWPQWHTWLFEERVAVDMPAGCEENATDHIQDCFLEEPNTCVRS